MDGISLAQQVREVRLRCQSAAQRSGRNINNICLVGVSKGQSATQIHLAKSLGITHFGENYVQEWLSKKPALENSSITWHFIGHLQSNKVKDVVGQAQLIHTLDRLSLAQAIAKQARQLHIQQSVLIEVNIGGESSKNGVPPQSLLELVREVAQFPELSLEGLMVMPPPSAVAEDSRVFFKQTHELFQNCAATYPQLKNWRHLSMGTSQDFEIAIEEGATILRLGTVLLGARATRE